MKDSSVCIQLHPIIEEALFNVEMREYQVGLHEDLLEWDEETRMKWKLSADERKWNQNVIGVNERVDDGTVNETRDLLESYKQELDEAKTLLRIYMDAFNGGWQF